MGDIQTSAYQATMTYQYGQNPEQNANINSELPDQFTHYENKTYNPMDFYTSSGEYNLANFNKRYREEQLKRIQYFRDKELQRMEKEEAAKPNTVMNLSIRQQLIQMKNTFFDIWSDLQNKPITMKIFTEDDRMYYIGLFFVIVFIIYLILSSFIRTGRCC